MSDIPERPRARDDLVLVRHERNGESHYVVKDPVSERYFTIGEDERRIIDLLDGSRTPADVLSSMDPEAGITKQWVLKIFLCSLIVSLDVSFLLVHQIRIEI